MRKIYTLIFASLLGGQLMAGGILTNTNQSAQYVRMWCRDATLGVDAVYFNPAGLTLLPNNGFYLSLNSQTLGQTKVIKSDYPLFNESKYIGDIFAPVFPGVYLAYKMDKLAFSAGFNPIAGGGGGKYDKGLPSFEYSIADLVPSLQSKGAQGYRMDAYFEGTSAWFGYQANVSYQINDMISVALGGRFVQAKDTYKGHLYDVELNMGGTWMPASTVFNGIASTISTNLQALIDGGGGGLTLDQAVGLGYMTQDDANGIINGVGSSYTSDMTISTIQPRFASGQNTYSAYATVLGNQDADSKATGSGVTPIISVNIKPNDQFNFAFKYEHKTKIELTNETSKDFIKGFNADGTPITQFPDGQKNRLDLPSQIVVGATYKPIEKLLISTGYHLYLDKQADWNGRQDKLDGNSWEFGLGLEYSLSDKLAASMGWLTTKSGASNDYQNDMSYSLPSNTVGGGFEYKINDMINVNLAGSYTMYAEGDKTFTEQNTGLVVKETYDKDVWIVAVGVNFNFGAGK